jgi:CubicO group peptidase (beta-lactamase class C family)
MGIPPRAGVPALGRHRPRPGECARTAALEGLRVRGIDGEALTLRQALEATNTDGLVVLHKGVIVLEDYANGMTARSPHILMSVSKSMLGLLAGILADRGVLDLSRLVTDIVPEVKATAWAGATVGQLLDMRVWARRELSARYL